MKRPLQNRGDDHEPDDDGRRVVRDVRALRALAHPDRLAILRLLMARGPCTATQCAAIVPASPSACSYHLRELERFGFVERVESSRPVDRRTRQWRASAIGFSLGGPETTANPAGRAVYAALRDADRVDNDRLAQLFVDHFDELSAEWQDASEFAGYELIVTVEELRSLVGAVDDLLRPYRVGARADEPHDAANVHVVFHAFPRLD